MSDTTECRALSSAADVTEDVLKDAEEVLDGWFSYGGRIDWEEFLERLEQYNNGAYDFPEMDSPAVQKIQRHIRRIVHDAGG